MAVSGLEWQDGFDLAPRHTRALKRHLDGERVMLVNNGDGEVVRISGTGGHRQAISSGTLFSCTIEPR